MTTIWRCGKKKKKEQWDEAVGGWAVEWSKEAPHARCARGAVERSGAAGTEQGEMWWMVVQFDGAVQQWWTRHMKSSRPEDGAGGGGGGCGRGG